VFPRDHISDRRVRSWVENVAEVGFCLIYEARAFAHLWLPRFWEHQVINRPTESQIPPHPDDPYGHLPVREAMKEFREDSLSTHGGLTGDSLSPHNTHARARAQAGASFPFLSTPPEDEDVLGGQSKPGARARAVRGLFEYWQDECDHSQAKLTHERRQRIEARLREGYTEQQIRQAIDGAARAPFVNDQGKRFDDIELICRSGSKLESFMERMTMVSPLPARDPALERMDAWKHGYPTDEEGAA
jgi:hypothetical protein